MGKRLAAVLAVVVALLPGVAFGFGYDESYGTGTIWSGNTQTGYSGFVVNAFNKYNAAIFSLGYNPWEIGTGFKEKLSDANYGGKFYEYAQAFSEASEPPEWLPVYALVTWYLYKTEPIYTWKNSLFIANVSNELMGAAKVDLIKVLNGEDVGGGGAGSDEPSSIGPVPFTAEWSGYEYVGIQGNYISVKNGTGDVFTIRGSDTAVTNQVNADIQSHAYSYIWSTFQINAEQKRTQDSNAILISDTPIDLQVTGSSTITVYDSQLRQNVPIQVYDYTFSNESTVILYYGVTINNTTKTITVASYKSNYDDISFMNTTGGYKVAGILQLQLGENPGIAPPSGDWPENPTPTPTPDPPEVPSPTDPEPDPEPDPDPITADPYTPTLPPLTYPTVTTEPTNTTPADYTPWLRQILAALNSIHTDLANYSHDIVSGLNQVISAINALAQSNVNAANKLDASLNTHCEHLRTNLDNNFSALKQYLKQLFEWLEDKMDWDAAGYDDSALLRQLRSIEAKLGGGTYRPNPSDNPSAGSPDFFAWLSDLLGGLITALLGLTPEVLGQLTGAFDGLTDLFPISIPWDIMAMLALFAAEPVTPVFDMPVPVGGALAHGTMVMSHVDLTDWDGIASVVRTLELVLFGFAVAQRVPEWLGLARTGDE